MIDTKELRRLAQAATPGPWKACRSHECYEGTYFEIDPEDEAEYAARPFTHIKARAGAVTEAHDLFEFDRKDAEFIAAANPETILELLDCLEAAEKERDELRAKVEAMERQELGFRERCAPSPPTGYSDRFPLYALPGAQSAPSGPDVDALAQFIREVDGSHQLGAGVLAERIAEWLKAAPEAKP